MEVDIYSLTIALTYLGDAALWILIAINMYWCGKGRKSLVLFFFIIMDIYLNDLLKELFKIPRPSTGPTGMGPYGFPSGHTETVTLATVYLTLENPRLALLLALIPLVGYTRVALGVHTVLDVVGGAFVGLFIGMLAHYVQARLHGKRLLRWETGLAFSLLGVLTFMYYPHRTILLGGFLFGIAISMFIGAEEEVELYWACIVVLNVIIATLLFLYAYIEQPIIKGLLSTLAGVAVFIGPKLLARIKDLLS